jgi:hypothetical protein
MSSLGPGLLNEYDHFKSQVWYHNAMGFAIGIKNLEVERCTAPAEDGQVTSLSLSENPVGC